VYTQSTYTQDYCKAIFKNWIGVETVTVEWSKRLTTTAGRTYFRCAGAHSAGFYRALSEVSLVTAGSTSVPCHDILFVVVFSGGPVSM
jgi:hypothetical protein